MVFSGSPLNSAGQEFGGIFHRYVILMQAGITRGWWFRISVQHKRYAGGFFVASD
jgi:hypothetical protein